MVIMAVHHCKCYRAEVHTAVARFNVHVNKFLYLCLIFRSVSIIYVYTKLIFCIAFVEHKYLHLPLYTDLKNRNKIKFHFCL